MIGVVVIGIATNVERVFQADGHGHGLRRSLTPSDAFGSYPTATPVHTGRVDWLSRRWCFLLLILLGATLCGCRSFRRNPIDEHVATSRELTLRGVESLQKGRVDEAERYLAQAVEACPDDDRARRRYAEVLLSRGAVEESIEQLELAVQASGDDPALQVQLGETYLLRGQLELADEITDQALRANTKLAPAWALKGRILEARGDLTGALAKYHRSLSLDGKNAAVQLAVAEIYRQQGEPLRAYSTLRHLTQDLPDTSITAEMCSLQGLALRELQRYRQAIGLFEQAIDRSPDQSELYAMLAECQWLSGDMSNARLTLAQARRRFPQDSRIAELASRAGELTGEFR